MLTRMLFVAGLLVCGGVVLTGAWPRSVDQTSPQAQPAFVTKPLDLDADIIGSGIDARRLLQKAIAKLDEQQATWSSTKIRQTSYGGLHFVAEGFLQRGPNQCARLEMKFGAAGSHLVTVSDGEVVAMVQKYPGAKPIVEIEPLPAHKPDLLAAREAFLTARSCGGPAVLLRPIHEHLQAGNLQTGTLDGLAVILVQGDLEPSALPNFAPLNLTTLHVRVYLEAATLWPHRIEWSGAAARRAVGPLLHIEFRDPTFGVALDEDECARLFSYHADGSEHVTQK